MSTLILRKLDPSKCVAQYLAGAFKDATLPTSKVVVEAVSAPSTTGHMQTFRDANNCLVVLQGTNNEDVKKLPTYKPRCFWCMQDLVGKPVPLPLSIARWAGAGAPGVSTVFDTEGMCCSFECALAYTRHVGTERGDGQRREVLLKTLYRLQYPHGAELCEAPSFRLLDTVGGTMTVDGFSKSKNTFVQLPNVAYRSGSQIYMTF